MELYFKFEKAPFPDVEPSYPTDTVIVEPGQGSYTVEIPALDPANTYSSFLLYLVTQDVSVTLENVFVVDSGGDSGEEEGEKLKAERLDPERMLLKKAAERSVDAWTRKHRTT